MTAAVAHPVSTAHVEVRPHRTREGRLDYVTVVRERDGVVRVLGWYDSRYAADRSLHPTHLGPATALHVAATLATAAARLVRPRLIRPRLIH